MIRTEHLTKIYNRGAENEFTALSDVSVTIPTRSLTLLQGASGSGKTTLLSLIGMMSRPTAGRIYLNDEDITGLPEHIMASRRRLMYGVIFQKLNLISGISARENVMLPAYPLGKPPRLMAARAKMLLERFGLKGREDTPVEKLSGGQAQRVAIARAMMNDPQFIIADEPTAHLDAENSHIFMQYMQELVTEGRTVVIASHDPLVAETPGITCRILMQEGQNISAPAKA